MNRRITISILTFCLAVIVVVVLATSFISEQNKRHELWAVCRLFASLQEEGVEHKTLRTMAQEQGYSLVIHPVDNDEGLPLVKQSYLYDKVSMQSADGQWVLYLVGDTASMLLSARATGVRTVMLLMLVAALVFSFLLARSITKPIRALTEAARDITHGDYAQHVQVYTHDEMGNLSHVFNEMSAKLQETIQELNWRSAEMDTIISAMRNGLIVVDEKMQVLRINPAARTIFGVYGNPHGKYILDVTRSARLESHLAAAMEQGEVYTADLPVRVEKENRLLRLYVTGLVQDSEAIGALAMIEDITELRRLENARIDFVANVTHELKTPLTSIRGFVETLQDGAIEDTQAARRFLSIIAMETERLARLIDDVLNISSLQSGKNKEILEPLALSPYLYQMCELLQAGARAKNITLTLEDSSGGTCVMGSVDKFKQLLINLIDNAIKYTPEDGRVDVTLSKSEKELVLAVRDNGIGIGKEHVARLFERFYRVDTGRSRSMGGTGLGLSIVKHIVLDMNGNIQVQSEVGEGSTFTVYLPIAQERSAYHEQRGESEWT